MLSNTKTSFYYPLLIAVVLSLTITTQLCAANDDVSNLPASIQNEISSQTQDLPRQTLGIKPIAEEAPVIEESEQKDAVSKPENEGPKFFVKDIMIEGVTIFSKDVVAGWKQDFANKEHTFLSLKKFTDIITAYYRAQGYTTSRAYLPPQTVENQTVLIKVIEGKYGQIIIENNKYYSENVYRRLMKLPRNQIFRYQNLESALYYLNSKSDRKVRAYLTPGKDVQSTDIVLKAQEKFPIHAYYGYNNRGTKLTHRSRHTFYLDHNNFLGLDDTLNTFVTLSEEGALTTGGFSYALTLPQWDATLGLSANNAESLLVKHLKPLEIKGDSIYISPSITKNLYRVSGAVLDAYLGFEYKNSKTLINDIQTTDDRVRALVIGPRFSLQGPSGKSIFSTDIHVGLPEFMDGLDNIDSRASRSGTGGEFTYYTVSAARIQRLPNRLISITRLAGQWTDYSLTSSEQYRLGGAYTVRGYSESESSGDRGWNFSEELHIPSWFLPDSPKVPGTNKKWKEALRWVYFIEGGKTYQRDRQQDTSVKDFFLLGTGLGIRFDINDNFSFQADYGFPIGDDSSDKNNPRIHLSLKSGF